MAYESKNGVYYCNGLLELQNSLFNLKKYLFN